MGTEGLEEAEFSPIFYELDELQDRCDSQLPEELGISSRRRGNSTPAMHLLVVDYSQSNRELLK